MEPLGISLARLAGDLRVSEKTLAQIIGGRRRISRTMAHKLHMRLKTSAGFWLNAQFRYDVEKLRRWEQAAKTLSPSQNGELH